MGQQWVRGNFEQPVRANAVPSGQSARLFEVLVENVGDEEWVRFRFVTPQIGRQEGALSFAAVESDFLFLCQDTALPYLDDFSLNADVVVISFSDREVPFGASDHDATQYFEVFRVSEGGCIWEGL